MTRILLLSLTLLLTACSMSNEPIRLLPQASPTMAAAGITQPKQAQNVPQATVAPSSVPVDAIATQSQLISQLAASQADTASLQAQLADAKAEAVQVKLQIAEAERETAKYNAATTANGESKSKAELELVKEQNRKLELLNKAAQLENARLQLIADIETTKKQQALTLIAGALSVAMVWVFFRVVTRPHIQYLPIQEAAAPPPRIGWVDKEKGKWVLPPVPPGDYADFLAWAVWALHGYGLSQEDMVGKGKPYRDHADYKPVLEWADKWDVVKRDKKGTPTLTADGKTYCTEALEQARLQQVTQDGRKGLSPAPDVSMPEIAPLPGQEPKNKVPESGGGGQSE